MQLSNEEVRPRIPRDIEAFMESIYCIQKRNHKKIWTRLRGFSRVEKQYILFHYGFFISYSEGHNEDLFIRELLLYLYKRHREDGSVAYAEKIIRYLHKKDPEALIKNHRYRSSS